MSKIEFMLLDFFELGLDNLKSRGQIILNVLTRNEIETEQNIEKSTATVCLMSREFKMIFLYIKCKNN
jgi:hypothetical protein